MSTSVRRKDKKKWHDFVPKSVVCLLREPYSFFLFRKDLQAGVTVGIVALPLAMAFAIASGVPPERGIFTAVIAGFLISLLGGSRVQIGGPTGAFVVIVYGIVMREGYGGLIAATLIAAVFLLIMGFSRMGTLIKYIPYPLVTGFTTGIAVIIFSSQVKDFLGLKMDKVPADFIPKWEAFFRALPTWDSAAFSVAAGTLALILLIRRFIPQVPWGIASIVLATLVCWGFHLPVETIASRFGEIPRTLPWPSLPDLPNTFNAWSRLVPDAITIALLAGIESLLSAVVADGMIGGRHKSNCELVAQGMANLGSSVFGGIPATGAIARTATNVKTGGRTPVAGMIHAVTLFLIVLAFAPIVSMIPMAALSAVLVMVAWNMSEAERFRHLLKAPLGDVAVLMTSFLLTVLVDLTVAVEVGMILAAFLFMKRVSDLNNVIPLAKLADENGGGLAEEKDPDAIMKKTVPEGVEVYEINGPFFFGIADSLQNVLPNMERPPKVFILRMRKVPAIDATGLHALDEFYEKCKRTGTILILSGVKDTLQESFKKFGVQKKVGSENIFPHIDAALVRARNLVKAP
ncbi:MAG: sulfate permease [Verrucomicrobia bacterium]|nr:sulfate permease [Verrucomicrobiota bacterium]